MKSEWLVKLSFELTNPSHFAGQLSTSLLRLNDFINSKRSILYIGYKYNQVEATFARDITDITSFSIEENIRCSHRIASRIRDAIMSLTDNASGHDMDAIVNACDEVGFVLDSMEPQLKAYSKSSELLVNLVRKYSDDETANTLDLMVKKSLISYRDALVSIADVCKECVMKHLSTTLKEISTEE